MNSCMAGAMVRGRLDGTGGQGSLLLNLGGLRYKNASLCPAGQNAVHRTCTFFYLIFPARKPRPRGTETDSGFPSAFLERDPQGLWHSAPGSFHSALPGASLDQFFCQIIADVFKG